MSLILLSSYSFWLLLQVIKLLSWNSGMRTASEKCFYLVLIHFSLMELKQKARILKLWGVKMKDLRVFKSTMTMKWMKIKSLGIKGVPVGFLRCIGRNAGEQFKSSHIHYEALKYLLRTTLFLFILGHLCGEFTIWNLLQALLVLEVLKNRSF